MFRRRKNKLFSVICTISLGLTSVLGFSYAQERSSAEIDVLALGDSVAAGVVMNGSTMEYVPSYSALLTQSMNYIGILGHYYPEGVPGYDTQDVLEQLPSLNDKIKEAELITLTVGANDLLFYLGDSLKVLSAATTDQEKASAVEALQTVLQTQNDAIVSTLSTKVPANLDAILKTIKVENPDAKVYVTGYYNPFVHFPEQVQTVLLQYISGLNQSIESVTKVNGANFVDIFDALDDASDPNDQLLYIQPADIHPTSKGHAQIEKILWALIASIKDPYFPVEWSGEHQPYIVGYPDSTVRPEGELTRAEAATMFAKLLATKTGETVANAGATGFTDSEDAWYTDYVAYMKDKNIISGFPDGSFQPNRMITRAEFATMVAKLSGRVHNPLPFIDTEGHWAQRYLEQVHGAALVSGDPNGEFRPNDNIKRVEASSIMNRVFNRAVNQEGLAALESDIKAFKDLDKKHWGYYIMVEATNGHRFERQGQTVYEKWTQLIAAE